MAGTSVNGDSGDGGPATSAQLNDPRDIALDPAGNLYILDYRACRVRKVDAATQIITTVAGTGSCGFSGDRGPATLAQLNLPFGLAADAAGDIYIADTDNLRIRHVSAATGIISTIAGVGSSGTGGDGGPATLAQFVRPVDVAVERLGRGVRRGLQQPPYPDDRAPGPAGDHVGQPGRDRQWHTARCGAVERDRERSGNLHVDPPAGTVLRVGARSADGGIHPG